MYTYGMYRLEETSRQTLIERLGERVKNRVDPPEIDGIRPDLATTGKLFFVAESSERITALLPALAVFVQAGYQVVLVVTEGFKDPAGEAWDYLPEPIKPGVRILVIPDEGKS